MESEQYDFYQAQPKERYPWGQIFISIAAIVVTLIGAKVEGFNWIIYFAIPILAISFFLMIWDTPVISSLKRRYYSYRDKRHISGVANEYLDYLDKFKIVDEIIKQIRDMEWGEIQQRQYYFAHNRLEELRLTLADNRHSNYSKAIFLNRALITYLDAAENYIKECDWLVVQREVTYKHEHDKSKMLKLIYKYDGLKEEHNEICSRINKRCTNTVYLREIYDHTFSFMPKEIS